jgi:excisionase family DNA binding protein
VLEKRHGRKSIIEPSVFDRIAKLENDDMNADDLFTAPQVAKICSTDLKTIHNWVNRGEIKSFRTPGRHLRFRRQDILDFLGRFGYPIPEGFSPSRKKLVICDESEANRKSLKRAFAKEFDVDVFADQVDALLAVGRQRPDVLLISGDDVAHVVDRLAGKDVSQVIIYGNGVSKAKYKGKAEAVEFVPSTDAKELRKGVLTALEK